MKQKYCIILTAIFTLQAYGVNTPRAGMPGASTPEAGAPRANIPCDNSQNSFQAIPQPVLQPEPPVHRYSNRSRFVFPEDQYALENGYDEGDSDDDSNDNSNDAGDDGSNGNSNGGEYNNKEGSDTEIDVDYWLDRHYYYGQDDREEEQQQV